MNANCIGDDESSFTAEMNSRAYRDVITSKITINRLTVKRIEYNLSCGDLLEIPRVVCAVQYAGKKVIEVPFLLVRTMNNEYKILRNFLNYKLLNE
jgi:hypothetical protein